MQLIACILLQGILLSLTLQEYFLALRKCATTLKVQGYRPVSSLPVTLANVIGVR